MQSVRSILDASLPAMDFRRVLIGIPCVTDCVLAELEKLGQRYRVALRYDLDSDAAQQDF